MKEFVFDKENREIKFADTPATIDPNGYGYTAIEARLYFHSGKYVLSIRPVKVENDTRSFELNFSSSGGRIYETSPAGRYSAKELLNRAQTLNIEEKIKNLILFHKKQEQSKQMA